MPDVRGQCEVVGCGMYRALARWKLRHGAVGSSTITLEDPVGMGSTAGGIVEGRLQVVVTTRVLYKSMKILPAAY